MPAKRKYVKSAPKRRRRTSTVTTGDELITARLQTGRVRGHRIGFMPRLYQTYSSQFSGVNQAGSGGGYFLLPVQDINSPFLSLSSFSTSANNPGGVVTIGNLSQPYAGYSAGSNIYSGYKLVSYMMEITVIPALAGDAVQVTMIPFSITNQTNISTIAQNYLVGSEGSQTAMANFGGPPVKMKRWHSAATVAGMSKAQWEAQPAISMTATPLQPYSIQHFVRWQTIDGAVLSGQIYWNVRVIARFELSLPNVLSN